MIDVEAFKDAVTHAPAQKLYGRVTKVTGMVLESIGPVTRVGELCQVIDPITRESHMAEVIGFSDNRVLLMPLSSPVGIKLGDLIEASGKMPEVRVGPGLLGRILNGLGQPIDDKGPIGSCVQRGINAKPINPMDRKPIDEPLCTGVRSIDGLLTCGRGQRMGIFAGSGVGKSTLLGMIARNSKADVNVISLVGERGREVSAFIEHDLGEEGVKRSVIVVSTSDNPPLIRMRAALTATAIAEYFCEQGKHVLLMMDSVTRFAMAQREVGLSAGEPPSAKGYTPSVFALLPQLLERAGNFHQGSITGIYTVLVEGDDMNEPVSDAVRSILDGHIVLTRRLASKNHYPAIDVLDSISRLMNSLVSVEQSHLAGKIRDLMATYKDAEDLINIGAYAKGSNPAIDQAVAFHEAIESFLKQAVKEGSTMDEALSGMAGIFGIDIKQFVEGE
ncbi:MAG: flagellar protein export ATPase FliI [Acidobacteria bacterium]|nr:MAG: flagellar protein export ATPase FliI [Acidobacteriota bacterium]